MLRMLRAIRAYTVSETYLLSFYFRSLPDLANNPLVERIIATIDTDKSGDVDFQEFVMALSVFIRGDKEDKLKCMYAYALLFYKHPLKLCFSVFASCFQNL